MLALTSNKYPLRAVRNIKKICAHLRTKSAKICGKRTCTQKLFKVLKHFPQIENSMNID
jgi:hypothetical protein